MASIYEQLMMDMIRKAWFPDHVATVSDDGTSMLWAKPGTGIYAVKYRIIGSHLVVLGDIGCAVYRWSDRISFNWLSRISLDYFHGKCEASEDGRIPDAFDDGQFISDLDFHTDDNCPLRQTWDGWAEDGRREPSPESWRDFVSEFEGNGFVDLLEICPGSVIPIRIIGHWLGLVMAGEQRSAAEQMAGGEKGAGDVVYPGEISRIAREALEEERCN